MFINNSIPFKHNKAVLSHTLTTRFYIKNFNTFVINEVCKLGVFFINVTRSNIIFKKITNKPVDTVICIILTVFEELLNLVNEILCIFNFTHSFTLLFWF